MTKTARCLAQLQHWRALSHAWLLPQCLHVPASTCVGPQEGLPREAAGVDYNQVLSSSAAVRLSGLCFVAQALQGNGTTGKHQLFAIALWPYPFEVPTRSTVCHCQGCWAKGRFWGTTKSH